MFPSFTLLSAPDFARSEFFGCCVGDPRRQRRVVTLATAMASRPGRSLPYLFDGNSYQLNASYDLFKRPEATPDNLQSVHRDQTRKRCSGPGVYLLLEDTTDISYSGGERREGLGPIGNRKAACYQGLRLHSVLAVRVPPHQDDSPQSAGGRRSPVDICGIVDQQYLLRAKEQLPDPNRKLGSKRKRMAGVALESERWLDAIKRSTFGADDSCEGERRFIRVADREADMYEYLLKTQEAGQGFVVRASQNRRLEDEGTRKLCGHLMTATRSAVTPLGTFKLDLRARPKVAARTAQLSVGCLGRVLIQAPQRPGHGQGALPPVPVHVVRVWEANPPAGVKDPLEWILLSSEPADTFERALEIAEHYSARWIVEEFHKALKSGMGAEELQLERGERLMAAIAIMSVVALRLVGIRETVRLMPEAPADKLFDKVELKILALRTKLQLTNVHDAMRAMAKLGGFLGRKGDGEPGMMVLWRGLMRLQELKEGYMLALQDEADERSQE